jgi:arsenite methyltransferase
MNYSEINKRYSTLAESSCCLSCGGAINYADARIGEVCCDLGSGRGTDAMRLAGVVGPKGYVYGIDISEGMVRKSNDTGKKLGLQNIQFRLSSLENTGLRNDIADLVISNCTINHAYDKQAVWNEVYRILKKGGRFIVSDIYSEFPVPDKYRNDPVAVSECWAGSVTREEYLLQLKNAGFESFEILEESEPYKKGEIIVSSWTIKGIKAK